MTNLRKFKTEILIRDKRFDYLKEAGLVVDYETLSDDEFIKALQNKLIEESIELSQAKNKEDIITELSDVLEVIDALIETHAIDKNNLETIKKQKFEKMGGFNKKIKTHSVGMPDGHSHLSYYLSHPDKYPEIK